MPAPLSPEELARIRALLEGGQAIEAIKYFREVAGGSLAEAKAAIEQLGGALKAQPLQRAGRNAEKVAQIGALVAAGNKIEAIKLYRQLTRCDLAAAKQAIDQMAEERAGVSPASFSPPNPSGASLPTNAPMKSGCFGVLVACVVPLGGVATWLLSR